MNRKICASPAGDRVLNCLSLCELYHNKCMWCSLLYDCLRMKLWCIDAVCLAVQAGVAWQIIWCLSDLGFCVSQMDMKKSDTGCIGAKELDLSRIVLQCEHSLWCVDESFHISIISYYVIAGRMDLACVVFKKWTIAGLTVSTVFWGKSSLIPSTRDPQLSLLEVH